MGKDSLINRLWNIALKAPDMDSEMRFLSVFSPQTVQRYTRQGNYGSQEFFGMELGGQRVFLFSQPVFEHRLEQSLPGGLTHVAFMVENLDGVLRAAGAQGIQPLLGPYEAVGTFGRRLVAFFRSPNGFVFEAIQILSEDPV